MKKLLKSLAEVKSEEIAAVTWALLYIVSLFLSYYVLRPIRDESGVANGIDKLPWLFTGTLVVMLIVSPAFAYLVRKFHRNKLIILSYRFLALNLVIFSVLFILATPPVSVWVSRAFFIWVSVFNLFAISVFWSFVVDIFNGDQGKRLFGLLSAGATLGGLLGATLTSILVEHIGHAGLLILSAVFIELAVFSSKKLSAESHNLHPVEDKNRQAAAGGSIFSGMVHTFQSPYLLGLAFFILLYSLTSTFLYYQQASIAEHYFTNRAERTAFFANMDIIVNSLTLLIQVFITGRVMHKFGVMITLCALPLISILGFSMLAVYPALSVLVAAQVARRVSNFAFARPTREVLFTSSSREDRYKAKNFIDTVIYRGGDQAAGWGYASLTGLGLSISQLAVIAIPLSLVWFFISVWLGRRFNSLTSEV
ncbi:NTP/NDP exchange transporter [Pantoea osteomyelitidis]|uniref:NTP/NDP exchange transporter n=1 Tax=Pantoea osteomyelitidis TaxID=3230026 RepID=A0ABW7Q121_9GAMM